MLDYELNQAKLDILTLNRYRTRQNFNGQQIGVQQGIYNARTDEKAITGLTQQGKISPISGYSSSIKPYNIAYINFQLI